ncbi:hypothetical protein [Cognaticolwellia aestuarii]|uniref:hypothetical protein n=1 Tax=Cognaticolwellia aestuarii TaxID=329993 RepID=UPI000985805C|nr:hypothetical protein [Cognaticolwellia aestuarii]
MTYRIFGVISGIIFLLAGCATSSFKVGNDFSSENVSKIVKGKTTSNDMVLLFGEPFTKSVISAKDEKWVYMYSNGTAKAQSYIVTMKVETTGTQKTLDVLITDGVVSNFTYTEKGTPYTMQVN